MQLSRDDLTNAYTKMRTIRVFEERVHKEFATGQIPGFVHLYAGEEASAIGVCMQLNGVDYITSTHRGHGHCIGKGCDVGGMMKEIYGRQDGLCKGKGGSMHIADVSKGMLGANGIVGGGPPLACGAALAAKQRKTGGVAVAFFGDGAFNQGTTLEAMNFASVYQLPVFFVLEDNGYAESTSSDWSIGGHNPVLRARGFGIPGERVDGHDFFAVYRAAKEAIDRIREGGGPQFLHIEFTRYYGHFEGDAMTYRPPGEVTEERNFLDCLSFFRARVTSGGLLENNALDQIDRNITQLIDKTVADAKAAAPPQASELTTDVYQSY
ncbi:thiamine pyrophosphate-dependent dehydrogenase E1 component subunit alpha [Roseiarcaceae bacterium H3SJ34-1]|uniref:thiamine pyrophosphate-dependent dehydrogenase E1 component subunit alpha n=1 Tax=Terripilifer ovatus TaxID=3032367 RepID=UPI003AB944C5|nr:thiamine pyrophosphate-dependent dehydrogenase E1 component subunit alpha [Roseiarcaceae bacterium H3SJ34-1]